MTENRFTFTALLLIGTVFFLPETTVACTIKPGNTVPTLAVAARRLGEYERYSHSELMIDIAIEKTLKDFGPCKTERVSANSPMDRILANYKLGENSRYDIASATVTSERDELYRPISFPVYRGLMGYRILVVNRNNAPDLSKISSIEELREKVTIGVGSKWADSGILKFNKLEILGASSLDALYRMLPRRRFDAIIRGAHEVITDQFRFDTSLVKPEPHIVIAYPLPANFYVPKNHTSLAKRILTGLERAQSDGTFDRLFANSVLINETQEDLNLYKRKVIYLCNHKLRQDSRVQEDDYWVRPWPAKIKSCQKSFVAK